MYRKVEVIMDKKPFITLDLYRQLQEKHRIALYTSDSFRKKYKALYDWLNDNEPDVLEDYLISRGENNYELQSQRS